MHPSIPKAHPRWTIAIEDGAEGNQGILQAAVARQEACQIGDRLDSNCTTTELAEHSRPGGVPHSQRLHTSASNAAMIMSSVISSGV